MLKCGWKLLLNTVIYNIFVIFEMLFMIYGENWLGCFDGKGNVKFHQVWEVYLMELW